MHQKPLLYTFFNGFVNGCDMHHFCARRDLVLDTAEVKLETVFSRHFFGPLSRKKTKNFSDNN